MNQNILNPVRLVLCFAASASISLDPAAEIFSAVTITTTPLVELQPNSPLAGQLSFDTDVPAKATYRIRSVVPGEAWIVRSSRLETHHALPVLGLSADTEYVIDRIEVEDSGGMKATYLSPLPLSTSPLPADFPALDVRRTSPGSVEPGYTYIPYRAGESAYSMALDVHGRVRWYIPGAGDTFRMSNGMLFGLIGGNIVEMDLLGNIHRSWHSNTTATPYPGSTHVDTQLFHHDTFAMPNGNILTFSREDVSMDNFPTDELTQEDPGTYGTVTVRDEPLIEFDSSGAIVKQWKMRDILDLTRLGYGSFLNSGIADWVHNNAVVYDSSDNSLTISARHQDAIFKIDYDTGALKWILADHANWAPEFQQYLLNPVTEPGEEFEWHYHQHSPMYLPNGNLLIFDNHNFGASPPDPTTGNSNTVSRAREYAIDPVAMTVELVWEHGPDEAEKIYAIATSDADWMPTTDNVLLAYGRVVRAGSDTSVRNPRVIEVDRDGNRLFEVALGAPDVIGTTYRAEKFPSLYGPEFLVTYIPEPASVVMMLLGCGMFLSLGRLRD